MDGLVAGAVADGDGVDAYMGGDGAADGAGAGVYVVLARESALRALEQFLMRAHSDQSEHRIRLMRQVQNDHIDQAIG